MIHTPAVGKGSRGFWLEPKCKEPSLAQCSVVLENVSEGGAEAERNEMRAGIRKQYAEST
jgi:hypothetical protein